jgi:RimJ/RimL family protein N-acetyltransferase
VDQLASGAVPPILRSARLHLEPYVPADEDSFVALLGDTQVSRWMGDGPAPEEANRKLFWRVFAVYAEHRFDVWAVRRGGQYVGHAEIKHTETVAGYEIIYALAPTAWGTGLGTELAATLVEYGFGTLGLTEVHATVAAPNHASLAVLQKLGFVPVRDITNDGGSVTRVLTRGRDADAYGVAGDAREEREDRVVVAPSGLDVSDEMVRALRDAGQR